MTVGNKDNLTEYEILLGQASRHVVPFEQARTYLEAAGFTHEEVVASNILGFFLQENEHGFGNLWSRGLLTCIKTKTGRDINCNQRVMEVRREVVTHEKKRIDLLVVTSEYVLCIENKINASLYNDPLSYVRHAISVSSSYLHTSNDCVLPVVLSLVSVDDELRSWNEKLADQELPAYVNVTYAELFDSVKNTYSMNGFGNTKWIVYATDFMQTIRGLMMKKEAGIRLASFFENNAMAIHDWSVVAREFQEYIKKETDEMCALLQQCDSLPIEGNLKPYHARGDFYSSIYYDFPISIEANNASSCALVFEMFLNGSDWLMTSWVRGNNATSKQGFQLLKKQGFAPCAPSYFLREELDVSCIIGRISAEKATEEILEKAVDALTRVQELACHQKFTYQLLQGAYLGDDSEHLQYENMS